MPVTGKSHRLHLEFANHGRLVMPATLELPIWSAGGAQRITIPAEAWRRSNTLSIDLPVIGDVREVVLDPDHKLPLDEARDPPG